jgi:nucleoside-diphosphate-sugar epimerase
VRAFVTGATGFVGSHLVEALLDRGAEVACLVRDPAKSARLFPTLAPQTVIGDLSNERALRDGMEGADVIFHLAGITAARSPEEFFAVNDRATRRVLDCATRAAPGLDRFVYVSSLAAAGPTVRGRALTEADPARPVSAYGAAKLAAENAVREGALPWTVLRPPAVYGPRDVELLRLFKFARWGIAPVFGDGRQELTAIHVRDLVEAMQAVVAATGAAGGTYFATHAEVVTAETLVRQIHSAVRAAVGKPDDEGGAPWVLRLPHWATRAFLTVSGTAARLTGRATVLSPDKGDELLAESWSCSPAALERDTGWRASTPYAEGLAETARWYHEHGLL